MNEEKSEVFEIDERHYLYDVRMRTRIIHLWKRNVYIEGTISEDLKCIAIREYHSPARDDEKHCPKIFVEKKEDGMVHVKYVNRKGTEVETKFEKVRSSFEFASDSFVKLLSKHVKKDLVDVMTHREWKMVRSLIRDVFFEKNFIPTKENELRIIKGNKKTLEHHLKWAIDYAKRLDLNTDCLEKMLEETKE